MTTFTTWPGGTYDTRDGQHVAIDWAGFGAGLASYAENIVPKGMGMWLAPAISVNGRCRDQDIVAITQLCLDADGTGEWHELAALLDGAGITYVMQRSARHRPELPKWHVHIPLALPWSGPKPAWRVIYRHCVAWLSVAAGLPGPPYAKGPRYGFDHATDRLGQPWFLAARRSPDDPPPHTVCKLGLALDLPAFLACTGFDAELRNLEPPKGHRRRRAAQATAPAAPVGLELESLLEHAFALLGWLGPRTSSGAVSVLCPWRGLHTTGHDLDGSTVLFPPTEPGGQGWFHCSHGHCCDRSQADVLRAIPPEVLQHAMNAQAVAVLRRAHRA